MRAMPPAAAGQSVLAPTFVGSEVYLGSTYGPTHPLRVARVSTVMDLARALGWLPPGRFQTSPRAKPAALHRFHTPAYVTALQTAEATGVVSDDTRARHQLGTLTNPVFAQMFRRPATGCGGVLWAAEALSRAGAGAVHVPGGGTHHGLADRANGFCYLNDIALGIHLLLDARLTRIAYVDLDAHHCDGVEAAFSGDPRVRMISVHEEGRWPFAGHLTDTAGGSGFFLPVPRGYNDTEARVVLHDLILPRVEEQAPQVLIVQCGADQLLEDPLSRLCLSNRSYLEALAALRPLAPRLLVLGGGGYHPWAVGRLWTAIWGWMSGQEMPDRLEGAARAVLAGLGWNGGNRPAPANEMLVTLLDAPREGPVRPEIRERLQCLRAR